MKNPRRGNVLGAGSNRLERLTLACSVSVVSKPASQIFRCNSVEHFTDSGDQGLFGTRGDSAEVAFHFGPHQFNWIEVG